MSIENEMRRCKIIERELQLMACEIRLAFNRQGKFDKVIDFMNHQHRLGKRYNKLYLEYDYHIISYNRKTSQK